MFHPPGCVSIHVNRLILGRILTWADFSATEDVELPGLFRKAKLNPLLGPNARFAAANQGCPVQVLGVELIQVVHARYAW